MRIRTLIMAGACLFAVAACTSVRHQSCPYQAVGTSMPIEVSVSAKADQHVSGAAYYRVDGRGEYVPSPLERRADRLWTMLPTDQLEPDETVEYYIDVSVDGKLHALGSPAAPYRVRILDQADFVLAGLHDQAIASDSTKPVRIVLYGGDHPIGQPTIVYQIPGLPGDIRTPMEEDGRGNFQLLVPARSSRPGTWRYAIEVPLDGEVHRLPEQGFRSFQVRHPQRTASADE